MCCTRLAANTWTQKSRQKSPSGHHRTTLSRYIFATKARIDNRKKTCQFYVMPFLYFCGSSRKGQNQFSPQGRACRITLSIGLSAIVIFAVCLQVTCCNWQHVTRQLTSGVTTSPAISRDSYSAPTSSWRAGTRVLAGRVRTRLTANRFVRNRLKRHRQKQDAAGPNYRLESSVYCQHHMQCKQNPVKQLLLARVAVVRIISEQ